MYQKKMAAKRVVLTIIAVAILGSAGICFAGYESVQHVVRYYGGTGRCSGDDLSWAYSVRNEWADHIINQYDYDKVKSWYNMSVDYDDFDSKDYVETTGTDWADVIMFFGHGNYRCNSENGWESRLIMGDSSDHCNLDLPHDVFWEILTRTPFSGFLVMVSSGVFLIRIGTPV